MTICSCSANSSRDDLRWLSRLPFFASLRFAMMMKAGCVAFTVAAAQQAVDFPTPPESLVDFGEGLIQGLITDNADVIQCLAVGITPVALNVGSAGKDFFDAVRHHDDTKLVKAAKEMGDACGGLEPMLTICDPAHKDVMGILDILKDIHGPMDLAKHVAKDVEDDFENILKELEAAFKSFGEKDWSDFGVHLGTFLHRLVVGKYPDEEGRRLQGEELPPLPPVGDIIAFAVPFANSLLSDKPDLMMCGLSALPVVTGVTDFAKDFKNAVVHHNMTALTQSLKDVAGACNSAGGIKQACAPVGADVKEIVRVMKTIDNVAGLIDHVIDNLKENPDHIEDDLDKAFKAFRQTPRDLSTMGDHLGKAVHRILIEKYPDDLASLVNTPSDVIV